MLPCIDALLVFGEVDCTLWHDVPGLVCILLTYDMYSRILTDGPRSSLPLIGRWTGHVLAQKLSCQYVEHTKLLPRNMRHSCASGCGTLRILI